MRKGRFITLEGVDGSGKSMQLGRLEAELGRRGFAPTLTAEPGATLLGRELRRILLTHEEPLTPVAELMLFAADRAQHVESVIRPAVEAGGIVICDRFMDSTAAYQGWARGLGLELTARINEFAVGDMLPDISLVIDLDPGIGLRRIADRADGPDRIERERIKFHLKVREGYIQAAAREPGRIKIVDGHGDPDAVFSRIMEQVEPILP